MKVEYNETFGDAFHDRRRYKICMGSAAAGKSYFYAQYLLSQFVSIPGFNVILLRKIADAVGGSVFTLLQHATAKMGLSDRIIFNQSTHSLSCPENGNIMVSGGMNDIKQREKIKSKMALNGPFTCVLMEEATEFLLEDYIQANIRLRGELQPESIAMGLHMQMILLFNPISIDHWIKKEFELEIIEGELVSKRDDVFPMRVTVDGNAWATDEDIEVLDKLEHTDPYLYNVYRLGNWGVIGEHNVVIPYKLVWEHRNNKIDNPVGQYAIGIDPARFGDDTAVLYMRKGNKKIDKVTFKKSDGFTLADAAVNLITRHRQDNKLMVRINIDVTGVGASCADILNKRKADDYVNQNPGQADIFTFWEKIQIHEVAFGGTPKNPNLYKNIVTEMYYELRDMIPDLDAGFFDRGEEKLVSDLTRRQFKVSDLKNNTVMEIESKAIFKKRNNGTSPDEGDAFVLACWRPPVPHLPVMSMGNVYGAR